MAVWPKIIQYMILLTCKLYYMIIFHSVNGGWSSWSDFGQCSVTCGIGLKTQHRTCTNPAPAFGGTQCDGDQHQDSICLNVPCMSKHEIRSNISQKTCPKFLVTGCYGCSPGVFQKCVWVWPMTKCMNLWWYKTMFIFIFENHTI